MLVIKKYLLKEYAELTTIAPLLFFFFFADV
jgi:hypothetical protein